MKWVKKECDHIIADSHHTKADIQTYLDIPEEKISVVYPYVEMAKPSESDIDTIRLKFNLNKPFILSVGKREPRKNIPRLIEAFESCNIDDLQLVIVGPSGWGDMKHGKSMHQNVSFLGFVSDKDLNCLYSLADFFVYPSLYEGFGYPIIEAMTLGCPVATSNVASLQEIADNNALLFDPLSIDSISNAIKTMHSNPQLRQEYTRKGLTHVFQFSKKAFVENLLSVLSA